MGGGKAVVSDDKDEMKEVEEVDNMRRSGRGDFEERDEDDEEEVEEGRLLSVGGGPVRSSKSFIVDDLEEEEEEENNEDSDEEKHRKKRRVSEGNYVLDEDDYELLQDNNIAVHRPKPVRNLGSFTLSEKYMTPKDDVIRETDIPERIQMMEDLTGPPPTDDKSIEEESVWIYSQLSSSFLSPLFGQDQLLNDIDKGDIGHVLTMLHVQKLDIPFIAMYRKELCRSLLKNSKDILVDTDGNTTMKWHKVLWAVHNLDRKWLLLQKRKSALHMYYSKRFEEEARRIDDETRLALNQQIFNSIDEALMVAKSEQEVDDIDSKFNLYFPSSEDAEGQIKRSKRKSLYSVCYKSGLWEVVNKFGFNSEQFGLHLSLKKMRLKELQDGKETPEEVASNFTCAMFEKARDVLKGARHMAAVEIGYEPVVKNHVRSIFLENAIVSTSPTPEGNTAIDIYHQLYCVKWLKNKPLSKFTDAQWLLIQKGEQMKFLQVIIKLPKNVQKKLLVDAKECYLCECVSKPAQLWNEQRKFILENSFHNFILPLMKKEARSLLTARAKNWLLMEYGKQLWDKVSVAPYQWKRTSDEIDNDVEPELRVMACCWGPGKPANTFVMLDSAGEVVDIIYAGSISLNSQGFVEQQRRKGDQERLIRFMIEHQPHIVCLGAANLSCLQLKDDIYEVILKLVEDHSRDISHDIIWGDESLPRLFENARVSTDQLPGQPGIVKRAVALGRYLQNPLAMVATLCGSGKEILSWKLCPLDDFLTPDEKYDMVEQIMVDATNQIGVDVNLASSHEWHFAPLQFVAGLGPRKASALQRAFVRAGSVFNRKEVSMGRILMKKVFINAVGFLRIRPSGEAGATSHIMDLLDDTRIHPESYLYAKRMANDVVCEDNQVSHDNDETLEMAVEQVREKEPSALLKCLVIKEYEKIFFEKERIDKMETLEDIKNELLQGFKDWRHPFSYPGQDEEFSMLCGETDDSLSKWRTVKATVRFIQKSRIVCSLDSGLKGFINAEDFSDECYDPEKVKVGDMLTCKIKFVNKNRFFVQLTCKESEMMTRHYIPPNLDDFYQEDDASLHSEHKNSHKDNELVKKHFKSRLIIHPHFQNATFDEAMKMANDEKRMFIWDDKMIEIYIRICVGEVMVGNRPTTHLNEKGWANLQKKFKRLTKKDLDSKQLKNKWDDLKKDWQLWRRLISRETVLGWNPSKKTIEASDKWWDTKLKELPDAIKFREKGLILPDEMKVLFGDIVAGGKEAWTPSSGLLPTMEAEINELEGSEDNEDVPKTTETMNLDFAEPKGKSKRFLNPSFSQTKKQSMLKNVQISIDRVESVNKKMDNGIQVSIEVMKSLNIEDEEFFYDCLYMLTENKDVRNMFIGLNDPKMQVGYLRRMLLGRK